MELLKGLVVMGCCTWGQRNLTALGAALDEIKERLGGRVKKLVFV
jgi:hypothetical protein